MEKFPVILLSGQKRSGKDTLAEHLCNQYSFSRCAFADYLKHLCARILTNLGVRLDPDAFTNQDKKENTLLDLSGKPFVFAMKSGSKIMTARQFLQYFGTEIGREMVHDHIWITPVAMLIRNIMTDSSSDYNRGVVVTDCRFPNEYAVTSDLLRGTGARVTTVLIERPGLPKTDLHPSETAMNGFPFDYVIKNDTTIDDLWAAGDGIMKEIS